MNQETSSFFQMLHTIFLAILVGQMLFAGVVLYMFYQGEFQADNWFNFLEMQHIVPGLILLAVSFLGGPLIKNRMLSKANTLIGLEAKLGHYRGALILIFLVVELGNIGLIALALYGRAPGLLLLFVIGLAAYARWRPSPQAFASWYTLSAKEQGALDG
jgi:hypothetical protein